MIIKEPKCTSGENLEWWTKQLAMARTSSYIYLYDKNYDRLLILNLADEEWRSEQAIWYYT